jgi:steroid 5-alpha reductase family enzyme
MNSLELILWTAAGAAVLMTMLWIVQLIRNDATIVDVGWAYGLLCTAIFYTIAGPGLPARKILLGLLAGIWAARLGTYLFVTRVYGRTEEDGRYRRMRRAMGRYAQPGFFVFFHAQTLFVVIFALPFISPVSNPHPLHLFDACAVLIWLIAFSGECIADFQLTRYRRDPANAGTTCQAGLWHYSRHPNYFFEWLHWFAYIFLAVGGPHFWLSLLGPVIMLIFLYKVTGIPHTETQALSHREDYAEYMKKTSMFLPWFPKNTTTSDE